MGDIIKGGGWITSANDNINGGEDSRLIFVIGNLNRVVMK